MSLLSKYGLSAAVIVFSANAMGGTTPMPTRFAAEALGQNGRITLSPGFSPDGATIYFSQSECSPIWECPQRLKRSTLGPNGWSSPEPVAQTDNGRVDFPSVTPDGRALLFSWATERERHAGNDVYEDFDLYRLDLTAPNARPRAIDDPDINRLRGGPVRTLRYVNNENAPVMTRTGDLYFWTERLDGVGNRDVYIAPSDGRGGFLPARPLPEPINSTGDDDGSWIDAEGKLMLISYADRGGLGNADVFVSHKRAGRWSEPVNLGPSVNSNASDFAARLSPDATQLVFSSTRPVAGQSEAIIQVWVQATKHIPALRR